MNNKEKIPNGKSPWTPGGAAHDAVYRGAIDPGSSTIPIGAYTVYPIPARAHWTLVVNKERDAGAAYDEKQDIARTEMETEQVPESSDVLEVAFAHVGPLRCTLRIYIGRRRRSRISRRSNGPARISSRTSRPFSAAHARAATRTDSSISSMRHFRIILLLGFLSTAACAQTRPRVQISNTSESLRGVTRGVAGNCLGERDTWDLLRTTDGGRTWIPGKCLMREKLDFRGRGCVFCLRSVSDVGGPGELSRIHHTLVIRAALAAPVHQHQSQGIFRFDRVLGFEAWCGDRRPCSR